MMTPSDKHSLSYQEQMARRLTATARHQQQLDKEFPPVDRVYDGFYQLLAPSSIEHGVYFLGAGGIVASTLTLSLSAGAQREANTIWLTAPDGHRLARLPDKPAQRLRAHLARDWHITALIAAVYYHAQSRGVSVEVAFICWDKSCVALAVFSHNIADRLASGDHAGLELSQEQLVRVLKSQGRWFLTKSTPYPPDEMGRVLYRKRRSGSERLAAYALRHRWGCTVLASLFFLVVLLALAAAIWVIVGF
ncbi:MAG: hypothetical protein LBU07_04000 [Coriobacteriales bacterium]|jgi:hypothetical protein|nr:hypothetical protein [Coriobacteriales bacterium]